MSDGFKHLTCNNFLGFFSCETSLRIDDLGLVGQTKQGSVDLDVLHDNKKIKMLGYTEKKRRYSELKPCLQL